jgi:hypothetical protein
MQQIIAEIAGFLDMGDVAYMHKETHEVLSHPDPNGRNYDPEYDYLIQEVTDIIDLAPQMYVKILPPDSRDSYQFMEDFASGVTNERIRNRLLDALSGKKPFKFFRNVLEEYEETEAEWFEYHQKQLEMWALDAIERGMAVA